MDNTFNTTPTDFLSDEELNATAQEVSIRMKSLGATLATAESCTGGLIASRLTAIAGASSFFKGGVVSYCNEVKESVLGVRRDTLDSVGAVSESTARQMAEGVRRKMETNFAIATTGVAGPSGGTPTTPVGTVWIAIAAPSGTIAKVCHLDGNRLDIIRRAAAEALHLLLHTTENASV